MLGHTVHDRRRRPAAGPLSLCASALAFGGLLFSEGVFDGAHHEALNAQPPAVDTVPGAASYVSTPEESRNATFSVPSAASHAEPEVDAAVSAPVSALITMPDLEGMRMPEARSQLRALGLKVVARDEWADPIPRETARRHRVFKQSKPAGTELDRGTWVRITARERVRVAQGY
jgi:hypothetical protein